MTGRNLTKFVLGYACLLEIHRKPKKIDKRYFSPKQLDMCTMNFTHLELLNKSSVQTSGAKYKYMVAQQSMSDLKVVMTR